MRTWLHLFAVSLLAFGPSSTAAAQEPDPGPAPPHLTYADGTVELELDGQTEAAMPSTALLDGDRVRTRGGRAEIVFADGTVVHLDRDTLVEVMSATRLRMSEGRMRIETSAALIDGFVIDTAAASIDLTPRGEYAVAFDPRRRGLTLDVARGLADADTWSGRVAVHAGERADITDGAAPRLSAFNSARGDAFDHWSDGRLRGFTTAASAAQLPYELRAHGPVMDRHGTWGYVADYGDVWFPRVGPSWRPYAEGRWRQTRYGLTWMGHDPWAWPTHHYGRWGFSGGVWFWIPARTWGPAWVSWAYAPSYVSWAPLGWDGRPVLAFSLRVGHDPWRAWTVIPVSRLGARGNLRGWTVDGRHLPSHVRTGFQVRPGRAEPRRLDRYVPPSRRGASSEWNGASRSGTSIRPGVDTRQERGTRAVEATTDTRRPGTAERPGDRRFTSGQSGAVGASPGPAAVGDADRRRPATRPVDSIRSGGNRPGAVRAPRGDDPAFAPRDSDAAPPPATYDRSTRGAGRTAPSIDRAPDDGDTGARRRGVGVAPRSDRPAPTASRPSTTPQDGTGPPPSRRADSPRAVPRGGGTPSADAPAPRGDRGGQGRPGAVRRPPP
ncbi:MAG: FecR domain-containing protein [Vicinamibacterales bacterium]|nr:FecR domain-containing protein [Vicinamibacterales bacterium]